MNYVFTLDSVFQVSSSSETTWQTCIFHSYIVLLLIYVNETIYLLGNLPFFKIQVNHFMAQDNSPSASVISKWMLWVRGLVPLWVLRHLLSIINSLLVAVSHSSTRAWKIPWMEEPGGLQSMGSRRVGQDWATSLSLFTFMHWRRKWQPTPVFLPGESPGRRSLVGCHLWGRTESDTTEAT